MHHFHIHKPWFHSHIPTSNTKISQTNPIIIIIIIFFFFININSIISSHPKSSLFFFPPRGFARFTSSSTSTLFAVCLKVSTKLDKFADRPMLLLFPLSSNPTIHAGLSSFFGKFGGSRGLPEATKTSVSEPVTVFFFF
jgi:hypothetical protein